MSDNRREALEALRDKVKAGDHGFLSIDPNLFDDREVLFKFLTGTQDHMLQILSALISEPPKGETP